MMHGSLNVSSELDKGSIFSVNLPLPTATEKIHDQAFSLKREIIGFKGEKTIIIVADDKLENRLILAKMLSSLGFKILEAENGQQAVQMSLAHQPELIFMDLVMPGIDGYGALEQIQGYELPIPVIAVSASTFVQDTQKTARAGFVEFLPKPINYESLLDCLQRYLDLDWIYKNEVEDVTSSQQQFDIHHCGLSSEQIKNLYDFADMGDVQGVLDYLDTLNPKNPNKLIQSNLNKIRRLAEEIECEKICELLQQYA
jgi:CheY-like chemotaxis protein